MADIDVDLTKHPIKIFTNAIGYGDFLGEKLINTGVDSYKELLAIYELAKDHHLIGFTYSEEDKIVFGIEFMETHLAYLPQSDRLASMEQVQTFVNFCDEAYPIISLDLKAMYEEVEISFLESFKLTFFYRVFDWETLVHHETAIMNGDMKHMLPKTLKKLKILIPYLKIRNPNGNALTGFQIQEITDFCKDFW